jgi:hypothetical protein
METSSSQNILTPFNYDEWKPKMIAFLKRQCLFDMCIGNTRDFDSDEEENDWLNDCDRAFGAICLAMSPCMRYLSKTAENPSDLWVQLDREFGKQEEEDHASLLENKPSEISLCVLSDHVLASTIVQDEEETVDSTLILSKSSISNSEQDKQAHTLDSEEVLESSPSHEFVGMQNNDLLDVLEVKSDFGGEAFALLDCMPSINLCSIICKVSQSFNEDEEHYHSLEFNSHALFADFGFDLTLVGSKEISRNHSSIFGADLTSIDKKFKFQELFDLIGAYPTSLGSNHRFQDHPHIFRFVLTIFGMKSKFIKSPHSLASTDGEFKHMFLEHNPFTPKSKIPPDISI